MTTTIAKRTFQKKMPDGRVIVAKAVLDHIDGNQAPHFSLTGEEWRSQRDLTRNRDTGSEAGLLSCGRISEQILEAFPELAVFDRIHLADDDGSPIHDVENGWYWYSDYDGKGTHLTPSQPSYALTPHERAARHLRIEPADLPEGLSRDEFAEFVETLRPRWKQQAEEALAFLKGERI